MRKRKSRGDCARARLNDFAEKTPNSFKAGKLVRPAGKAAHLRLPDHPRLAVPENWPRHRPSKSRRSCDAPAVEFAISVVQTLTSGPREAGPFGPPLGPLGFGLRGTVRLRAPGSFSGFGVTGPSTYSKPIFS